MKAAFFDAPHLVAVRDTAQPEAAPDRVVVRVAAAGLCGTDQHILQGDFVAKYPLIGGHELAGEIVSVGEGVESHKPGDRVAVDPSLFCGHCFFCQRNEGNHCLNWNGIGVTRPGGFAEYVSAPAANIYQIGDMSYDQAAFIEPVSCVVYALNRVAIPSGAEVLIFGAGPMGLLMTQLVRHGNASRIVVVDKVARKLELARSLGANDTVEAGPRAAAELRRLSPLGFDVVIDVTGIPAVVEAMFAHARPRGKVLFFGVCPSDSKIALNPFDVYKRDLEIFGSFALCFTFHQSIALLKAGAVQVGPLITHRFALDDFAEALRVAGSGEALKVQLSMSA
jgi:2-desacetyl-2-hydroxyethyl bacteriochlorophyllide A dehydrogenase